MNFLFSGHNGYLGSNIIDHLMKGNEITVVDRYYNIIGMKNEFDCFFYFSNPNEIDFNVNSEIAKSDMLKHFYSLMKMLDGVKISHLIYASTVRIYDENINDYAKAHLDIENLLIQYMCIKSIDLTIIRNGNIFGGSVASMMKRNSLVPHIFIKNALENNRIDLLTNGEQCRDFTPISLVCKYIDFIINNKPRYIDVCSGINIKVVEILNIITREFPALKVEISDRNLNEKIVNYTSLFPMDRVDIEGEIIKTIYKWRGLYDSDAEQ